METKPFTKRLKAAIGDNFNDLIQNLTAARERAGHSEDGRTIAATLTDVKKLRAFFSAETDPKVEE